VATTSTRQRADAVFRRVLPTIARMSRASLVAVVAAWLAVMPSIPMVRAGASVPGPAHLAAWTLPQDPPNGGGGGSGGPSGPSPGGGHSARPESSGGNSGASHPVKSSAPAKAETPSQGQTHTARPEQPTQQQGKAPSKPAPGPQTVPPPGKSPAKPAAGPQAAPPPGKGLVEPPPQGQPAQLSPNPGSQHQPLQQRGAATCGSAGCAQSWIDGCHSKICQESPDTKYAADHATPSEQWKAVGNLIGVGLTPFAFPEEGIGAAAIGGLRKIGPSIVSGARDAGPAIARTGRRIWDGIKGIFTKEKPAPSHPQGDLSSPAAAQPAPSPTGPDITGQPKAATETSPEGSGAKDVPDRSSATSGSTKTDRLKEHLTQRDLDGARRELAGEVVARKSGGDPWNHVKEVREAQDGLTNRIQQLKRQLGDSRSTPDDRARAQSELSEASRLLDYSRQFVPRSR
jgi:hypothetical protein